MSEQCKKKIYRDWSSSNCSRKAVKDGYCKQHHPDTVKERQEKSNARWNAKAENSDRAKLNRALDTIEQLTKERDGLDKLLDQVYDDICGNAHLKVKKSTATILMKREGVKHSTRVAKHKGDKA